MGVVPAFGESPRTRQLVALRDDALDGLDDVVTRGVDSFQPALDSIRIDEESRAWFGLAAWAPPLLVELVVVLVAKFDAAGLVEDVQVSARPERGLLSRTRRRAL